MITPGAHGQGAMFEIVESQWIDDLGKGRVKFLDASRHFVICCYDEVVEVVAHGFDVREVPPRHEVWGEWSKVQHGGVKGMRPVSEHEGTMGTAVETKGYRVKQNEDDAFRLDDDAGCWVVDGAIHMKVVTSYGDPVELTAKEARILAAALSAFADTLDAELDIVPP